MEIWQGIVYCIIFKLIIYIQFDSACMVYTEICSVYIGCISSSAIKMKIHEFTGNAQGARLRTQDAHCVGLMWNLNRESFVIRILNFCISFVLAFGKFICCDLLQIVGRDLLICSLICLGNDQG